MTYKDEHFAVEEKRTGCILLLIIATLVGIGLYFGAPRPAPIQGYSSPNHEQSRSGKWPKVRAQYLQDHPACEVCGHTGKGLEVHHVLPFRTHPALELDPANLITLCGDNDEGRCRAHYWLGHAGNFKGYNPDVRKDAALLKARWDRAAELAKENTK